MMSLVDNTAKIQSLLDGINALPDAGGSAESLFMGGKVICGEFIPAADITGEYTIITADDEAVKGLLDDGETFSGIRRQLALLVTIAKMGSFSGSNYPNVLGSALRVVPADFSYVSVRQFWNSSGTSNTMGGGTTIDTTKASITFSSTAIGKAGVKYRWAIWRCV